MTVQEAADNIVLLDFHDLATGNSNPLLLSRIASAFGPDGLGVLLVRNVPRLAEMRARLLPLASEFARLPDAVKESCIHPESKSHGKEIMNGKADTAKGSYYNNPMYECPPRSKRDPEYVTRFPYYAHENIWPTTALPELQPAFTDLGRAIVHVGSLIAQLCDTYIRTSTTTHAREGEEEAFSLTRMIEASETCKARLLHYFPLQRAKAAADLDSWCGLHLDSSMLTGLTSAMLVDENADDGEFRELEHLPRGCGAGGLHIKSRNGDLVKVDIPRDCLAFQLGEAAQVASRGLLVATPHLVKGIHDPSGGIARNTFAVFMQPNVDAMLTPDKSYYQFSQEVFARHYVEEEL